MQGALRSATPRPAHAHQTHAPFAPRPPSPTHISLMLHARVVNHHVLKLMKRARRRAPDRPLQTQTLTHACMSVRTHVDERVTQPEHTRTWSELPRMLLARSWQGSLKPFLYPSSWQGSLDPFLNPRLCRERDSGHQHVPFDGQWRKIHMSCAVLYPHGTEAQDQPPGPLQRGDELADTLARRYKSAYGPKVASSTRSAENAPERQTHARRAAAAVAAAIPPTAHSDTSDMPATAAQAARTAPRRAARERVARSFVSAR
eukprot:126525-Chlamydomonas_euryale.AAC.3